MLLKQKWVYVVFMLVFYPVAAFSHVSFYELPIGKTGYGFEFLPQTNVTTSPQTNVTATAIGARVDYGINPDSKLYFGAAIGFTDDDELGSYGGDIPPSPGVGLGVLHIQPLGQSELEYFMQGGFAAGFARVVDDVTDDTIVHSRVYTLSGGGGILKRLKTQFDWVIIPYFGLSYTNVWATVESLLYDYEETDSDGSFGGTIGLEIEMSPKMSLMGSFAFSFESSDTVFVIGFKFSLNKFSQYRL